MLNWKKKILTILVNAALGLVVLTGCGKAENTAAADTVMEAGGTSADTATEAGGTSADTATEAGGMSADTDTEAGGMAAGKEEAGVSVRIGSLKGPTSMGLVYLMSQSEKEETDGDYTFMMATAADELLPKMVSGDLDIALIPANVASILYHKTGGGISVIDINTLGVLYMVSGDTSIQTMEDLKGKTIYLTGKGTTPDYCLQYLLAADGLTLDDVTLEYKSEATEVAALLQETPEAIGVLPQPFVTAACMQNEALTIVMDLTAQWDAVQENAGSLVTGVTVVRKDFLEEHPDAVGTFLEEHKKSAAYANEHIEEAAELVAAYGIIEKAQIAVRAIPYCNITYLDGGDMKTALSGYLEILYGQDAASIGGSLPGEDFYFDPRVDLGEVK
ncbi:MAG: ABC transporter substrate-binding protein [Blautia sp.]|nr:ABC transporter substrate-binding protein [Lachnoclostridium sp.]MCM1211218.1 ABC transporter substrate-binding protein [Blautia sp.]